MMVREFHRQLVDDLDGTAGEDVSTVRFGLDGVVYEIDLTSDHEERLRRHLAGFIDVARYTEGRLPPRRRSMGATTVDRLRGPAIRKWALMNGYEVGTQGRIPAHILVAFRAAHPDGTGAS
jgi:hypothetical protein